MDKMIVIVGPTASGKTALSVALAQKLNGEVVSADSMQLYRGMDIGTAKVTPQEMSGVPHHMIDVIEPWEHYSAARYVAEADPIVQDILTRGKTAIIAGGTGLYVDALVAGRTFAPYPETGKRQLLEEEADRLGMEEMLERLRRVDPDSAARLHPADRKRVLRALEVYAETGKTITQHNLETQQVPPKYTPFWIGLMDQNRQDLYDRIDRRVEKMLEEGLLEEVQGLLSRDYRNTALQAIGYKELIPVLRGEDTLSHAKEKIQQESRRYAKRQLTWFRKNPNIHWITRRPDTTFSEILEEALSLISFFDGRK
ncbi:MAG: tRNA (adenosine(37)-N6)-dimethylallyltransferase MiaA [Oscillospiraceae bacterium]|nr:tRNA (adenosine(37)-N6)-dimethylallyltransferase MiaA [Oscillospiraceae bacterium]